MVKLNKWRIKEACEQKEMDITQLAGKMGYTTATFYNHLRDGFNEDEAWDIADILDVKLDQLTDGM